MDLHLREEWFILFASAPRGQEMKLVAGPRPAVAGAVSACVEPEGQSIGLPQSRWIAEGRIFLAPDFNYNPNACLVPPQPNVGEMGGVVEFREWVQPGRFGEFDEAIGFLERHCRDIGTGVLKTKQETMRN